MKGIVIARVCECAAPYVVPHGMLPQLYTKELSPTLYERAFG